MYGYTPLKQFIRSFNKSVKELEDLSPLPICLKVAWAAESRSHQHLKQEGELVLWGQVGELTLRS